MTDRLEQELDELFETLQVEQEASNAPSEGITVACFSHKADRRDWQRLEQHLEAVQWQVRERVSLTWTSDEGNPMSPNHIGHMAQVAEHLAKAHIIIIGLSVDMQLLLQKQEHLYKTFLTRVEEAEAKKSSWGQPPFIVGIRMKAFRWDESNLRGIEFIPRYQPVSLAGHHHKDTLCVEIAHKVYQWIEDILYMHNHQVSEEK